MLQLLGFILIPCILGYLGLKAAKQGQEKSKTFMIVMDALSVLAVIGEVQQDGFGLQSIAVLIVAAVFTFLIINERKK